MSKDRQKISRFFRPVLEELEDRRLMAWVPIGPAPQLNNPLATPAGGSLGTPNQGLSGRISDIAIIDDYDGQHLGHQAMLLSTSAGGAWSSSNFGTASPTWTP